jgi:hypothetical protein
LPNGWSVRTPIVRFRERVRKTDACWLWTGQKNDSGYGIFWIRGKVDRAHRVALMLLENREIPAGAFVCHHCDTPACVRPDHLFIGTHADNMADCSRKGRTHAPFRGVTHCKHGHEFTPENTRHYRNATHGGPGRSCRACARNRTRRNRARARTG